MVDEEQNLKGVITVKDVATANMDVLDTYILAEAKTSYQNIIDTLGATVVVGDVEGKRLRAASSLVRAARTDGEGHLQG